MLQHIQRLLNFTMTQSFVRKIRVDPGGACRTVENNKLFFARLLRNSSKNQDDQINYDLVISHKISCHYLYQIEELIRLKWSK